MHSNKNTKFELKIKIQSSNKNINKIQNFKF